MTKSVLKHHKTDKPAAIPGFNNLLGMPREHLQSWLAEKGIKTLHACAMLRQIHRDGVTRVEALEVPGLNSAAPRCDARPEGIVLPDIEAFHISSDMTRKWLLRFGDGARAEAVLIPQRNRMTLCVSSQAGCSLGCTFCATAKYGFSRNLNSSEIIGQLQLVNQALAEHSEAVTNVVFMGMGEPLLNLGAVAQSVNIMRDDYAYAIGRRKITISTAGHAEGIRRLGRSLDVGLTVSLHAPDDALRSKLVPLNKKYPVAEVLDACREYLSCRPSHESMIFAYTLLKGVNDDKNCARRLADLLAGFPAKVNLIPFNPFPRTPFERSSDKTMNAFYQTLLDRGIITMIRRARGGDIRAACGQLAADGVTLRQRQITIPAPLQS